MKAAILTLSILFSVVIASAQPYKYGTIVKGTYGSYICKAPWEKYPDRTLMALENVNNKDTTRFMKYSNGERVGYIKTSNWPYRLVGGDESLVDAFKSVWPARALKALKDAKTIMFIRTVVDTQGRITELSFWFSVYDPILMDFSVDHYYALEQEIKKCLRFDKSLIKNLQAYKTIMGVFFEDFK